MTSGGQGDPDEAEAWLQEQSGDHGQIHSLPRPRHQHPKGMEPGVRFEPGSGTGEVVAVVPPGESPQWDSILTELGFGDVLDVVEVAEVRAWNSGDKVCHYVKARVKRRDQVGGERLDVDALCREIGARSFSCPPSTTSELALVVALSDWQLGKRDGGGVKATIQRLKRSLQRTKARIKELALIGRAPQRVVVACLGDLVEGCDGHYAMQTFQVELDRREQVKLVRRMVLEWVLEIAELVAEVLVAAVPGNHGENRKGGKAFTTFGDNDDVAAVEQVAEICAANPALGHVRFVLPERSLTVTLDAFGVVLGLAHGHQARTSGDPSQKLLRWWKDCAHARHPVGDADVLLTGHYHHLQVRQSGRKAWIQAPSVDSSVWWTEQGGEPTVQGVLTFLVGPGAGPAGWGYLQVV